MQKMVDILTAPSYNINLNYNGGVCAYEFKQICKNTQKTL